jgi:predicted metal-dependent hydrolase
MNKIIVLNNRKIAYVLERKNVKNINLRIRSNCSIYVSANNYVSDIVIEEFLQKKKDYIFFLLNKYAEITKYTDTRYSYITGESFRYLGKDLRLVVTQGNNNVSSDGVYLTLSLANVNDVVLKKKIISKWYDTQCKEKFTEIITEIYPVFKKYGVPMPKLTLREMSTQWGSCHPHKGVITLNRRLIEIPREAIQYVVMHEFVHFLYPNHSKSFYKMMSTLMPDWEERKRVLENSAHYI